MPDTVILVETHRWVVVVVVIDPAGGGGGTCCCRVAK